VLDLNVLGALLCVRTAITHLSTRHGGAGGAIVLISSAAATIGSAGEYVWYAASKGAIDSMTLGLARELAGEGIRVNAVAPGLIDTEIHAPGRLERLAPSTPIGRVGTADEVAEAIVFIHPFRVARLRALSAVLVALGGVLIIVAIARDMAPGPWVTGAMCVIGLYFVGAGLLRRPSDMGAKRK